MNEHKLKVSLGADSRESCTAIRFWGLTQVQDHRRTSQFVTYPVTTSLTNNALIAVFLGTDPDYSKPLLLPPPTCIKQLTVELQTGNTRKERRQ